MTRLILVRHGLTDWNAEHRFQGKTDVPLNEKGCRQAQALGARLKDAQLDAIYASDLSRAWDTARYIAGHHDDVEIVPDARLREIDFGEWEGHTWPELRDNGQAELLERWANDIASVTPPNGESLDDTLERIKAFLQDLRDRHNGETLLLAAHGGTLAILICLALDIDPSSRRKISLRNTSVSILELDEKYTRIERLNDTHHLDNGRLN